MLLNIAAHNVSIRNVKVSKREHHITYSVTKRTMSQTISAHYISVTLRNVATSFWRVVGVD